MGTRPDPGSIVHRPCVFAMHGATREVCMQMTSIARRNLDGCVRSNCQSPLRICRACVVQGGEMQKVYKKGLCRFHFENGEHMRIPVQKPESKGPPAWSRVLAEPIASGPREHTLADRDVGIGTKPRRAPSELAGSPREPVQHTKVSRTSVRKGRKSTGLIRVFDAVAGEMVRKEILEVLEMVKKSPLNRTKLAGELRIAKPTFWKIAKLDRLTPSVKEMLSPDRKPNEVIGLAIAALLADFRPELQEENARQYLAGRISKDGLKKLLKDPDNRYPKQPRFRSAQKAEKPARNRMARVKGSRRLTGKLKTRTKYLVHAVNEFSRALQKVIESGSVGNADARPVLSEIAETLGPPLKDLTTALDVMKDR